jgi:uncharacterized RDD family membrane protein YckC
LRYWDGSAWTSHVTAGSTPVKPAGPTTPDGEPLAGWWWRVLAYVIDSIIVGVAGTIASVPGQMRVQHDLEPVMDRFTREIEQNPEAPPDFGAFFGDYLDVMQDHALWLLGPSVILTTLYWAVFLRWKGGTPGKLMLGMRVRLRDRAGSLPWSAILARMLVQFGVVWAAYVVAFAAGSLAVFAVAWLVIMLMLLDPLWATWDEKRQTLHDKLAGTNVVRP